MDTGKVFLMVALAVGANSIYAVQHKGNAVVTFVAGGALFVALAIVAGLTGKAGIATALAGVFLLSSLLLHGVPAIQTVTAVASNARKPAKSA